MKMCHKFWSLFWLLIALAVATLVYLMYFEPPFLSYQGLPFKVEGPARAGESVKLIVTRCNSSDKPREYEVTHWLKCAGGDQLLVVLPSGKVPPIKPGCEPARSAFNVVPEGTKLGWCRVGGFGVVKGTLRTVGVPWVSEWFEVIQ